jgi:hypothetical protein
VHCRSSEKGMQLDARSTGCIMRAGKEIPRWLITSPSPPYSSGSSDPPLILWKSAVGGEFE